MPPMLPPVRPSAPCSRSGSASPSTRSNSIAEEPRAGAAAHQCRRSRCRAGRGRPGRPRRRRGGARQRHHPVALASLQHCRTSWTPPPVAPTAPRSGRSGGHHRFQAAGPAGHRPALSPAPVAYPRRLPCTRARRNARQARMTGTPTPSRNSIARIMARPPSLPPAPRRRCRRGPGSTQPLRRLDPLRRSRSRSRARRRRPIARRRRRGLEQAGRAGSGASTKARSVSAPFQRATAKSMPPNRVNCSPGPEHEQAGAQDLWTPWPPPDGCPRRVTAASAASIAAGPPVARARPRGAAGRAREGRPRGRIRGTVPGSDDGLEQPAGGGLLAGRHLRARPDEFSEQRRHRRGPQGGARGLRQRSGSDRLQARRRRAAGEQPHIDAATRPRRRTARR